MRKNPRNKKYGRNQTSGRTLSHRSGGRNGRTKGRRRTCAVSGTFPGRSVAGIRRNRFAPQRPPDRPEASYACPAAATASGRDAGVFYTCPAAAYPCWRYALSGPVGRRHARTLGPDSHPARVTPRTPYGDAGIRPGIPPELCRGQTNRKHEQRECQNRGHDPCGRPPFRPKYYSVERYHNRRR